MSQGRDHHAEDRRADELAHARGFQSRSEQRKFPRHVHNRSDWERLPPAARDQRANALKAVSLMRENRDIDLVDASRQASTSPAAVHWYAGEALKRKGGRWTPTRGDRIYRPMNAYSHGSKVPVDVRGSHKASELSRYHSAVSHFRDTGDEAPLKRFAGKSVAGTPYETDPAVLEEMARRRQLDIDSIYQLAA